MLHLTPDTLTDRLHDQPADVAALLRSEDAASPAAGTGIVFAGTPEIAATCLRGLLARHAPITAVLTRPDAPTGRRRQLRPSAVAAVAQEAGLPVIKADRIDENVTRELAATGAALGVVVAYGALLPESALGIPAHGWVNLHYSLLPHYRGAAPVQHALLNGESTTAATIFQLERGMDTGPVHGLCEYPIPAGHSAGEVLEDLTRLGTDLLTVLLPDLLNGRSQPQPQTGTASTAPKLTRDDAFISFDGNAAATAWRINATIPEPGAWTLHEGARIKLGPARALDPAAASDLHASQHVASQHCASQHCAAPTEGRSEAVAPGTVLPTTALGASRDASAAQSGTPELAKSEILVLTRDAAVVLGTVQPAGKKMMPAADWLRGQAGPVRFGMVDTAEVADTAANDARGKPPSQLRDEGQSSAYGEPRGRPRHAAPESLTAGTCTTSEEDPE
ncbi:MAG TPA: methionyl-tRNA formyltransferase [Candidatus Nesterenkonia stercoripullorum]|uniref:Methionyl-tRNA formyltransferase n=1 Tax=Candidatus Nesterenkonia stercoripullorum TaxID=2838701 RepID=A0A9D1UV89_9MICC|nr:methionyl-tRNA formyltransferase [Candidatus Nesterenkonia stercoripullorum]